MRRIAPLPVALSYLATDPDADLAAQLTAVKEVHANVATRQWDPRHDTAAALGGARFDVIVAAHALGRLGLGAEALQTLGEVLAPGGSLLLVEPGPNAVWDFVFGQDTLWWRASLTPEFPVGPLRDGEGWRGALTEAGFQNAAAAPLASAPWPVTLLVAEAAMERAEAAERTEGDAPIVLIAEPDDEIAAALVRHFADNERRCTVVAPPKPADGADLGAALRGAAEHAQEVLVLPPLPTDGFDPVRYGTVRLDTLTTIAKLLAEARARLWVVTRHAQQPAGAARRSAAEGALGGLARVIANELPRLACRIVDLPESFTARKPPPAWRASWRRPTTRPRSRGRRSAATACGCVAASRHRPRRRSRRSA